MNKFYVLILGVLFSIVSLDLKAQDDGIIKECCGDGVIDTCSFFEYNDENLLFIEKLRIGQDWQYRVVNNYFDDGSVERTTNQNFVDGNWVNETLVRFTRDAQQNVLEKVYFNWSNDAWAPIKKKDFTYTSDSQVLTEIFFELDAADNSWKPRTQIINTYTDQGQLENRRNLVIDAAGTNWVNVDLERLFYYPNGEVEKRQTAVWNTTSNAWDFLIQETFDFDGDLLTGYTYFEFQNIIIHI